jgi:hypothetical protein
MFWFVLNRRTRDQTSVVSAQLLRNARMPPHHHSTNPTCSCVFIATCTWRQLIAASSRCNFNPKHVASGLVVLTGCCGSRYRAQIYHSQDALHPAAIAIGLLTQVDFAYTGRFMQYCCFIALSHLFPLTGRKSDIHAFFYPSRLRKHRATSNFAQDSCQS